MPKYIDIAVNLVGSALEKDLHTIIENAVNQQVSPLIVIGSDVEESEQASKLCQQYPQQLFSTAGVHPHQAKTWDDQSCERLKQLYRQRHVVAVGECGLDYNRDFSPRPEQRAAFEAQLNIAVELNLPVLMHERDASTDFIAILKNYRAELPAALLHCFTGNRQALEQYLELDLHLGVTGWVCDERRGAELASLVPDIPNDRLMLETDSPYLLPRSMRPKPKSSKNKPEYLPFIAQTVADLRQQPLDELAAHCYANSLDFFKLEGLL
ncbi:TatD family hydrolase [Shewanella gelidii]|uniref:DNase TatD n=1 Tax=Shewanella gelidii TaxID=1642821 RepID=A0A917JWX7_9GAMM|nr:TatD family hydrolase [Shewanella gelidii]MCL1098729.1 TatD family hydrolase [Shewanella gelidii]GGI88063.1 DNase TatD [Shewanella gelidii]